MEAVECDTANARLALRLEIEDIEEALLDITDPGEIAVLTDRAAALHLLHEETMELDKFRTDQRIQRSIYQAVLSDCREVDALLGEEAATSNDSAVRGGLDGAGGQRALRGDGLDGYYEDDRMDPSGFTNLPTYIECLKLDEDNAPRECYTCMVDTAYSRTIEVGDCNHAWCRGCLVRALDLAAKNESNYPVRCCGQSPSIPLDHPGIAALVGAEAISAVEAKIVEYETKDKTYCHDPVCSAFIAPDAIDETKAICPTCQKDTCALCKAKYHEREDCKTVNDEAFELWQRDNGSMTCNACHRVIIISHGCNHMRCFCGAEFCYECGQTWKTCLCERWHEHRLVERAVVVAERQAEHQGQPADVEHAVAELRNEGPCRHTDWTRIMLGRIGGSPVCSDCHWESRHFLWRCDGCAIRVCTRCRRDY
ncbi:hypothetical protein, variant 2 [Phialophora macrospora]|uniref:RBR-type E3 ubiquitin transferase n=1 Tax=Phialophora macrospora TaxID=1851006 RepID=A0A0D2G0E4_9EURO|nr:hypothetical protein PV04_07813 [Phialophora macrospora]KIW65564.1 hypothetical protein, variant 1 [Phialophora macrospora]KIW65565.1 hypothetical protein, variant 2 [Phialophora macrospora]